MLSFKQYIQLTEAKVSHFAHIPDFDPEQHKDLVSAYNELGKPTNQAHQIKTIEQFKNEVQQGLNRVKEKEEKEQTVNSAFKDGSVEKVYDNPKTNVAVYKPHNSNGCKAVQSGIIDSTCVFSPNKEYAQTKFESYDPSGQHSYVLHLNKEKDPMYQRIAIIGNYPGTFPSGKSFVDKGNNNIPDRIWERLKKEHGLDQIPALNGIRGIPLDKEHRSQELTNNLIKGTFTADEISNAKEHGYWNEKTHQPLLDAKIEHLKNNLLNDIKIGKHTNNDIDLAKNFKILTEEHKKALADIFTNKIKANINTDLDAFHAKNQDYINDKHRRLLADQLLDKLNEKTHKIEDLISANTYNYLNAEHQEKLKDHNVKKVLSDELVDIIKNVQHNGNILNLAKDHGFINNEAKQLLSAQLLEKIHKGIHSRDNLMNAQKYGYLNDHHRRILANQLMEDIKKNKYKQEDIDIAQKYGYFLPAHQQLLDQQGG